ncbi:hypothetical protein [Polynucleobacter antarcticus]|nr:hypothetical protein [Polynucleobacter antarcticus]
MQRATDFNVCRAVLLKPPLMNSNTLNEAFRQAQARGLNCQVYAAEIYRQQGEGISQLQGVSQGLMNNPNYGRNYTQPSNVRPFDNGQVCFNKGNSVSGAYRNCFYQCVGGNVVQSVGAAEVCPSSIIR